MEEGINNWIRWLSRTDTGQAYLSNLLYEIREGRVDRALLSTFLDSVARIWTDQFNGLDDGIAGSLADLGWESPTTVVELICNSSEYYCIGPEIDEGATISRVMPARDFFYRHIDHRQYPFIYGEPSREEINELIEEGIEGKTWGVLRGGKPLVWVTKTEEIHSIREEQEEDLVAYTVRNRLGLKHLEERIELVELKYPLETEALELVIDPGSDGADYTFMLHAPTLFDAGPSLIYRSKDGEDGWGRTVDLASMNDGLPEAVHEPVALSDAFELVYVGRLNSLDWNYDHEGFLDGFPLRWVDEHMQDVVDLLTIR